MSTTAAAATTTAAAQTRGLWQNERFRRYALAKTASQLAQNALMYGLFILVVEEQQSALATSAFILTSIVPSIVLSLPGGLVADAFPRKVTLVTTLVMRIVIAYYFIDFDSGLGTVLLLTLATRCVLEFYGTAESVALAAIVSNERMGSANAVINALSLGAQIAGAGIAAPLLLKAFDADALYIFVLALLVVCLALFVLLDNLTPRDPAPRAADEWRFISRLFRGWSIIRANRPLFWITTLLVLVDTAFLMVIVAIPTFITDVLHTSASNAVYIFAPSAIGVATGLFISPGLVRVVPPRVVVALGVAVFVAAVLALPFVDEIGLYFEEQTFLPIDQVRETFRIRRAIMAAALIGAIGGFGLTVVRVAARTGVYHSASSDTLGQVIATQSMVASVAALLPTVFAGLLVDAAGPEATLIFTGSATAILATLAIMGRFGNWKAPVAP
jgi:MFS family permease